MKKIQIALIVLMVSSLISSSAFAFDLGGAGKKKSSSSAVTMDDALKSQGALIESYKNGVKLNYEANSLMASALGNKENAAKYKSMADDLDDANCDFDCLEKKTKITEEANEQINKDMSSAKELSSEAKKKVRKSLIPLSKSVLSYKNAAEQSEACLDAAKSVIESASFTQKMSAKKKLDPVLTIAPRAPKDLVNVGNTLKNYIDFAKSHKVKIPKDATDTMGSL